jgi:hypothetical protein
MLFRNDTLAGIASGQVCLAFRRWRRPRVKPGTRLRTQIGVVEVVEVAAVQPDEIPDADVVAAGLTRAELVELLAGRDGEVYRVELRTAGPDPRVALRQDADLSPEDVANLVAWLGRIDRAAPQSWTWQALALIADNPGTVSTELAIRMDLRRDLFKRRIRRLKELGLTESLEIGYRLSPRGKALLRQRQ